jgi:hypothetical protein
MASSAYDLYVRAIALLLKGPRDPTQESRTFEISHLILTKLGYKPKDSPVVGVSLSRSEDRPGYELSLFLTRKAPGIAGAVADYLRAGDTPIRELITGAIEPTGRPAAGGDSLGEGKANGESGTLGALVVDAAGKELILTCHHVVGTANSTSRGSPVWQPSADKGGGTKDRIGQVYDIEPIVMGGITANNFDAALVELDKPGSVTPGVQSLGSLAGSAVGTYLRTDVSKYGTNTKSTSGRYLYRSTYLQHYAGVGDALFVDQLGIFKRPKQFSDGGDSGAVVLNTANEVVGLLFAHAKDINMSFANPIQPILTRFGVGFV